MFTGGNATGQNYLNEIIEINHLQWNNMAYCESKMTRVSQRFLQGKSKELASLKVESRPQSWKKRKVVTKKQEDEQ